MNDTLIVSQIFWPLLIILWISMIINKTWYQKLFRKIQKAHVSIFMMSIFSFIFWMYMIALHAWFWTIHQGFVTIIAFIIVAKSTLYLLKPEFMQDLIKTFDPVLRNIHYIGSIYLLVWVFISYIAYI